MVSSIIIIVLWITQLSGMDRFVTQCRFPPFSVLHTGWPLQLSYLSPVYICWTFICSGCQVFLGPQSSAQKYTACPCLQNQLAESEGEGDSAHSTERMARGCFGHHAPCSNSEWVSGTQKDREHMGETEREKRKLEYRTWTQTKCDHVLYYRLNDRRS